MTRGWHPGNDPPPPTFAPDEAAYYERRKRETERPLSERYPRWRSWLVASLAFFVACFAFAYWLLSRAG